MAFWDNMSLEPYRGFRWVINMTSIGEKIYAMKVDKPSFKVGEYSHKILNHQFNYPGRLVWDPVAATVVDVPGGPAVKLFEAVKQGGYHIPTGNKSAAGTDGLSKRLYAGTTGNAGQIVITQLMADPTAAAGVATDTHKSGQEWTLNNAFLTDIKFGSLDYASEDAVQITFTIRYDWAQMTEGAGAFNPRE